MKISHVKYHIQLKMAVKNLTLPHFPTFDCNQDISSVFSRWKKYKKRFNLLCTAIGVTDDTQKLSMLLTYVGDDTYEIYENIIPTEGTLTLNEVLERFDNHFQPQVNISYEAYLFHQMKQRSEETLHQYYIRLREQSAKCNFANTDIAIKQQIELSTSSNKLRRYSFQNPGKTLQELLTIGKTFETAKIQTTQLEKDCTESTEINAVPQRNTPQFQGKNNSSRVLTPTDRPPKSCYNCGGIYPHPQSCPAQGKQCHNCGKVGHFSRYCKSRSAAPTNSRENLSNPNRSRWGTNQRSKASYSKPLNMLENASGYGHDTNNSSDECIEANLFSIVSPQLVLTDHSDKGPPSEHCTVLSVSSVTASTVSEAPSSVQKKRVADSVRHSDFNATLLIEKQPIKVLIDTGASVNIMNIKTFEHLNTSLQSLNLTKSSLKVVTYGSDKPLKIQGEVTVLLETAEKFTTTKFYVVNTNHRNLLSGATALTLGIINMNIGAIQQENREISHSKDFVKTIPERLKNRLNQFSNTVFSGKIGQLTNHQVHLKIDQGVPPVAQKERRIPFALREKVNKEISKLERQGIIEDVTNEATPWISPIVVVPKADGRIRVCLDMRVANKAISRIRYPTPTIDDLMINLRGAKVFSKLDLLSAFHQLELSPESRSITTFTSDTRIKRFTRLIFGANSAQEELQHALREVLSGIEGVMNIADDVLIYGKNESEHDKTLIAVLETLEKRDECFWQRKIKILWLHIFKRRN